MLQGEYQQGIFVVENDPSFIREKLSVFLSFYFWAFSSTIRAQIKAHETYI